MLFFKRHNFIRFVSLVAPDSHIDGSSGQVTLFIMLRINCTFS
jgi:hypothetical protein